MEHGGFECHSSYHSKFLHEEGCIEVVLWLFDLQSENCGFSIEIQYYELNYFTKQKLKNMTNAHGPTATAYLYEWTNIKISNVFKGYFNP